VVARDLPTGDSFFIEARDAANNVVLSASGSTGGGNIKVH